jgi:hypothetical protein
MVLSLPCAPWQFFLTGTTSLYVVYKLKGWWFPQVIDYRYKNDNWFTFPKETLFLSNSTQRIPRAT